MLLRFVWRRLASRDLSQQALKIDIYHEWPLHLLVLVFERHLVLYVFGELCLCWPFELAFTFGLVPFEQNVSAVSMQTAFTEILTLVVSVLVIQEGCEPFHVAVVCVFAL